MLCHSFHAHYVCLLARAIIPPMADREEGYLAEASANGDGCEHQMEQVTP